MHKKTTPRYISVSRRTDVPRFFAEAFLAAWQAGSITYDGGWGRHYTVSLAPEDVLGYVFWSKDFAPLLADRRFRELHQRHNALFHFTINHCPDLEPRVPELAARLDTLARLCELAGPERVIWRFDPVCRYHGPRGEVRTNHDPFFDMLPGMAKLGITRCIFSFMTLYGKLGRRPVRFLPFGEEEKARIAAALAEAAQSYGIRLFCCCNPEVPSLVPGIAAAACVDADLLAATDRFGIHPRLAAKPTRKGCGCFESRDVGSYAWQCGHGCAYCYANPLT